MSYIPRAPTHQLLAENVLAHVRVIINVLRRTARHVNCRENPIIQLVVNACTEPFQATDYFILPLCYAIFILLLLLQTFAHSSITYQYLEASPSQPRWRKTARSSVDI